MPSSKYRDMDTSAWRHLRTNKDLPSTQNPEVGSTAQTSNERIEATTPALKASIAPITAGASWTSLIFAVCRPCPRNVNIF